jgi:hypothetical protein
MGEIADRYFPSAPRDKGTSPTPFLWGVAAVSCVVAGIGAAFEAAPVAGVAGGVGVISCIAAFFYIRWDRIWRDGLVVPAIVVEAQSNRTEGLTDEQYENVLLFGLPGLLFPSSEKAGNLKVKVLENSRTTERRIAWTECATLPRVGDAIWIVVRPDGKRAYALSDVAPPEWADEPMHEDARNWLQEQLEAEDVKEQR